MSRTDLTEQQWRRLEPHLPPNPRQGPTQCSWRQEETPRRRKKGRITDEWLGRSHGGLTSKIHLCVDGNGLPLSIAVTAGQSRDAANIDPVRDAISVPRPGRGPPRKRPTSLRVDRAYGARCYRKAIQRRGIRCVCPERLDAIKCRLRRGRMEARLHGSMPRPTKAAMSSSARSTG